MCYYCQETDEVCRDPVNVSILPAVRCAELNFVAARAAHVTEHGLAAQINDVIAGDIETRTANLGVQVYQCLKLGVTCKSRPGGKAEPRAAPPRVCCPNPLCSSLVRQCSCFAFRCGRQARLLVRLFF